MCAVFGFDAMRRHDSQSGDMLKMRSTSENEITYSRCGFLMRLCRLTLSAASPHTPSVEHDFSLNDNFSSDLSEGSVRGPK